MKMAGGRIHKKSARIALKFFFECLREENAVPVCVGVVQHSGKSKFARFTSESSQQLNAQPEDRMS